MIKVALIGVSGFGAVHYADIRRLEAGGVAKLVAATVINQETEALKCAEMRDSGCRIFADYREMLDWGTGKVHLCFIPTSIHMHAPMTIAALRAGANVFVEKPAAATIQEVRAMQAAEKESGHFVAVGFQHIYAAEVAWMKRRLLEGEIGTVRHLAGGALWPRSTDYYRRNNWAGRLRVGDAWILDSPANNALAHTVNLLCFLAGESFRSSADLETVEGEWYRARPDIESADTVCLRSRTRQGASLLFAASHGCSQSKDPEIHIVGDRGRMGWSLGGAWLERSNGSAESAPDSPSLREQMLSAVLQRILDPGAFICDLEIAAAQTIFVTAGHISSPIRTIAPEWAGYDAETRTFHVRDIDDAVERAIRHSSMFSELGVPWAVPANPVSAMKCYRLASSMDCSLSGRMG